MWKKQLTKNLFFTKMTILKGVLAGIAIEVV